MWADVDGVGSQSDAQIYNASELTEVLQNGEINLPDDEPLQNDDRPHPYFMLSDDAFALKSYMMKPYSRWNMTYEENIPNYRISRGRRVVENAFGIMVLRWPVLLTTMQQNTETGRQLIVMMHGTQQPAAYQVSWPPSSTGRPRSCQQQPHPWRMAT